MSRHALAQLIEAGFVTPTRGPRHELRFSFQDLMLLRTARTLQLARIPPRKIVRSLAKLKAELPAEAPLTSLRIDTVGRAVTARDASGRWEAESGQRLIDFGAQTSAPVAALRHASASDAFARAAALEAVDGDSAQAQYRLAIEQSPADVDAYLNLGALLCEGGRAAEAVTLYERALAHGADSPLIHFNRAVALEDVERLQDALASYRQCLMQDAAFADAHFNCARLHERLGNPRAALRHFNAYRRSL